MPTTSTTIAVKINKVQTRKQTSASKIDFQLLLFFAVLMVGVIALSHFVLSKQSLRLDESQSIWQSNHSVPGVVNAISHDVHVPLYGLLLHFWQRSFGDNVATGRLMSLIFFLLSIPAVYMLGKVAYNRQVAIFASLLVATSPFLNWYGNETRMYSLLALITILSQYFFIKLYKAKEMGLSKESLLYTWWGLGVVSFIGIYTHYFFWLVLLTEGVFFLLNRKHFPEHALRNCIIISVVLLAGIAPWLWYVKSQNQVFNQTPNLIKPSSVDFFNVFSQFVFGFQDDHINTIILSLWPLAVLFAFLGLSKKKIDPVVLFFLVSLLLPMILAFAVSIWIKPVFLSRYLIFAAPSLYIFISWFVSIYPPKLANTLKGILCAVMLLTLYQQIASANTPVKENYEQASQYITAHASPQDEIVLSAPFTIYPFEYYYKGPASITTLPYWDTYQTGSIPPFSKSELPAQVANIAADHVRIWLLLSYDQGYQSDIFNYFETHFQRIGHENFSPGLDLYVYQVKYPG